MTDMTEEEANALDEYYTKNLPKVDPSKGGITTRQGFRMIALDRLSEDYFLTMALATKKTPTELIGEMVREKLTLSNKERKQLNQVSARIAIYCTITLNIFISEFIY